MLMFLYFRDTPDLIIISVRLDMPNRGKLSVMEQLYEKNLTWIPCGNSLIRQVVAE